MLATIIFGSPRKSGNTASLLRPFLDELEKAGVETALFDVYEKNISGCRVCMQCQKDKTRAYCAIEDDMQPIIGSISQSDLIILAAPVYGFGLPGPVKTAWDRCIYPFSKYYGGDPHGPSLMEGKKLALFTTCAYPVDKATGALEESLRLIAKHLRLEYAGMLAERQRSYRDEFPSPEQKEHAREFARMLSRRDH